ncbi:nickel-dependent lactate racemase [Pelotomaculum propionicicum]|uniref:nickel-dependent lactate racemase n=1 Tax=Pelotomaculum propionicicum TaxID=258475 RepID=UPI003B75DBF5
MSIVRLPWGKEQTLNIQLLPGWVYKGSITPTAVPAIPDLQAALLKALKNPVRHSPFENMDLSSKRIAVVVDDLSRPTPAAQIFPPVLAELQRAGARNENISVVISLGTHRPMTPAETNMRLGNIDMGGCLVVNHDCRDSSMLKEVGTSSGGTRVILNKHLCEADLAVMIGTIEPHLLAGFGGGLKNIVPGCAGLATIASTHLRVEASRRFDCAGKGSGECLTRRDIEEAAKLLSTDYFIVNTVLNPDGTAAGVFCGHPGEAFREGCALAAAIYGSPVSDKADILLINSHPMDTDLRQGTKCLANALAAARSDALLVAFLRCRHGIGDMAVPEKYLSLDETRLLAGRLGTEDFVAEREKSTGAPMDLDEKYMQQFLCEIARRHRVLVYAPDLPPDTGERLGYFELFSDMRKLMKRAEGLKPQGSVLSSPMGGICYPVLK